MKHSVTYLLLVLAFTFSVGASGGQAEPRGVKIAAPSDSIVDVRDVRLEGSTVHGTLVNKSSQSLRDARLVVRHAWLWKNERNPGTNNPSRSEFYTFSGETPPGGSVPFTFRLKSQLPNRSDGHFITSAEVMSYTLVSQQAQK